MLRLADTSVRLYRKRDGTVSVRLRSYLMIHTNTGFHLSTYLNKLKCSIQIADGPIVQFDSVAFSDACTYKMDHMVHDFWASGSTAYGAMCDTTVGSLRLEYRLFSFEGQGDPSIIELIVPVVARGTAEQRFGAKSQIPCGVSDKPLHP